MPQNITSFKLPENYVFQRQLGTGSYGTVQAFFDKNANGFVAIKRICNVFDDFLIARRTLRETRLMRHFHHRNIVHLVDCFIQDADPTEKRERKYRGGADPVGYLPPAKDFYMASELMDYDLDQMIRNNKREITCKHVRSFTFQILMGLKYLHQGHVVHRDLKPANIFVKKDGSVKLGDLGLARAVDLDVNGDPLYPSRESLTEYVVTRWYRAPEILVLRGCYGPICDVWSVGCIMYEMITRSVLFPGKGGFDQLQRMVQVIGYWPDCDWLNHNLGKRLAPGDKATKLTQHGAEHAKQIIDKCSAQLYQQHPNGHSHRSPADGRRIKATTDRVEFVCAKAQRIDPVQRDLIQKMLQFNPDKRMTIDAGLQHPLFVDFKAAADQCLEDANNVKKIDMEYDLAYDNQTTDSKHMPLHLKKALEKQIYNEVEDWNYTKTRSKRASRSSRKEDVDASNTAHHGAGQDSARDMPQKLSSKPTKPDQMAHRNSVSTAASGSWNQHRGSVSSASSATDSEAYSTNSYSASVLQENSSHHNAPSSRLQMKPLGHFQQTGTRPSTSSSAHYASGENAYAMKSRAAPSNYRVDDYQFRTSTSSSARKH